jgi:homoserine O-acetyltransferase
MLSYRNQQTYNKTQTDEDGRLDDFSAESYQRYQGKKLGKRFDAHTYHLLSKAMDSHNIGRNFGGIKNALQRIESDVLTIGITSDLLFPLIEQEEIASHVKNGRFESLESFFGHDGFLIEVGQLTAIIEPFVEDK